MNSMKLFNSSLMVLKLKEEKIKKLKNNWMNSERKCVECKRENND